MTFPPKFILSDLKVRNRAVNRGSLRHAESSSINHGARSLKSNERGDEIDVAEASRHHLRHMFHLLLAIGVFEHRSSFITNVITRTQSR